MRGRRRYSTLCRSFTRHISIDTSVKSHGKRKSTRPFGAGRTRRAVRRRRLSPRHDGVRERDARADIRARANRRARGRRARRRDARVSRRRGLSDFRGERVWRASSSSDDAARRGDRPRPRERRRLEDARRRLRARDRGADEGGPRERRRLPVLAAGHPALQVRRAHKDLVREPRRDRGSRLPRGHRARNANRRDFLRSRPPRDAPVQSRRVLLRRRGRDPGRRVPRIRRHHKDRAGEWRAGDPPRIRLPVRERGLRAQMRGRRFDVYRPEERDDRADGRQGDREAAREGVRPAAGAGHG